MQSSLACLRNWTRLAKSLAALSIAALALPTTSRAIVVSNLVDTSTTLSFNFSGTGFVDGGIGIYDQIRASAFWTVANSSGSAGAASFSINYFDLQHRSGGSLAPTLTVSGGYGVPVSNSVSVAHGGGLDIFSLTITFDGPTNQIYSGSFSAVHREGSVPDGGSTAGLAGLALLALAGARRFYRTA